MPKRKVIEEPEAVFQTTVFCPAPHVNYTATSNSVQIEGNSTANDGSDNDETYEDSEDKSADDDSDYEISERTPHQKKRLKFNRKNSGVKDKYRKILTSDKPYDFFRYFIDDNFLKKMVDLTNSYAQKCNKGNKPVNSWIQPWRDTTLDEMRKFIGVVIWMGLVKYPTMNSYWCRNSLYFNSIANSISRSQFHLLSNMWRLGPKKDESTKMLSPLLNDLRRKFKDIIDPPEVFSIEKIFIPADQKVEGINMHLLQMKGGYIYNFDVSIGSQLPNIRTDDAMRLIDDVLDKGRILVANENSTSIKFAKMLLERQTNLIGVLNPFANDIPEKLKDKMLLADQTELCSSKDGIVILKYNKFSEQYLLTTRSTLTLDSYSKYRSSTSTSNELKVTNQVLLNSMNWYQKFAVEIVINTCLINACYLYRKIRTKKIPSIRFVEDIISGLLDGPINAVPCRVPAKKISVDDEVLKADHKLWTSSSRRRCLGCYQRNCRELGRTAAMNKTSKTFYECKACKKPFCVDCFFKSHTARMTNKKAVNGCGEINET